MAASPIYNPMIPCVEAIPGGMFPGRMIRFQGSTPHNVQRFAINLQCGPNADPRDDIALHLNFRFVEMCIVRNHLTSFNWGPEEISGGMPLVPGQPFEALVLCEPNSLKVAINGVHFCEFPHRLPYQRISHLTIDGDVNVQFIGFEGAQPPPAYMPQQQPPQYGGQYMPQQQYGAPQGYGPPPQQGGYAAAPPMYEAQAAQQRRGVSTGAAVGIGAGALAAGGLAGYALAGGFSSHDSGSPNDEVMVASMDDGGDFGGDDWVE